MKSIRATDWLWRTNHEWRRTAVRRSLGQGSAATSRGSCAKRGGCCVSVPVGDGNAVEAGVGPLLAPEEPRARGGGFAFNFLGADRIRSWRQRPQVFLPGYSGADR